MEPSASRYLCHRMRADGRGRCIPVPVASKVVTPRSTVKTQYRDGSYTTSFCRSAIVGRNRLRTSSQVVLNGYHESVARITVPGRDGEPSDFRRFVMDRIDPSVQPLPRKITKLYVWPTENCSIGCRHCNYASPKESTKPSRRAVAAEVGAVVGFALDSGARTVTFCGGGEPLDEPDAIRAAVDALAGTGIGFELYTSGHSNLYDLDVECMLRDLSRGRLAPDGGPFRVRLSVDHYHHERIGADPVAAWLQAIERHAPWIRADIRTTQLVGDESLRAVADKLGARVLPLGPRSARLLMSSGRVVPVKSKPLVIDGRITLDRLHRDGLAIPEAQWQRIDAVGGRGGRRLGRILSNRLPVTAKRFDYEVGADGDCRVLEVAIPDNRKSVFADRWSAIRDANLKDPIVHLVAAGGIAALGERVELAVAHGLQVDGPQYSAKALRSVAMADVLTASAIVELSSSGSERYGVDVRSAAHEVLSNFCGSVPTWIGGLGRGLG